MKTIRHNEASPDAAFCDALARVTEGDLCAGCGGCAGLFPDAIRLQDNAAGFPRPVEIAPLPVGADDHIASICPGLGQRIDADGRFDDPLWGPHLSAAIGWATDPETRHGGASGGALTAILAHLLDAGHVDGVVATVADPARPLANRTEIIRSPDDLLRAAGSRYAPSSPVRVLPEIRRFDGTLAFVGKPCDAVAMAAIRARDPEIASKVPVILSFFCGGVPSEIGGHALLARLGVTEDDVSSFRYRGNGWPGRATATLRDGTERSTSYRESWGGVLSRHVQHRCKICADGTGMAADIVCADAWEVDERGYPLFEEGDGISLILARTVSGQVILSSANDAGRLESKDYDLRQLADIQPGQRDRKRALKSRLAALRFLRRPTPRYVGLKLDEAARQNPAGRNLRNFVGTIRRALR